jgi:hypothetical protein
MQSTAFCALKWIVVTIVVGGIAGCQSVRPPRPQPVAIPVVEPVPAEPAIVSIAEEMEQAGSEPLRPPRKR